jgi:hypothetical protein
MENKFKVKQIEILQDRLLASLPECGVIQVDHVVGNQPEYGMEEAAKW